MRDFSKDHSLLSINTATVRKQSGVEVPLPVILEACARHEIGCISPWRDQVQAAGLKTISRHIKELGLSLSGYCRGGMFTYHDKVGHAFATEDNRRAVDEACELNAACLVLVVGGLPGALAGTPKHKNISLSHAQVEEGIEELLAYAKPRNMPLAIEPLHPIYAADRACINTLDHALDICDRLDPQKTKALGVALDVYHVWWDPKLRERIERCGKSRLLAFHVCDWLNPTKDLLNDRGMMGDGVIDIRKIRGWVEEAGFAGFSEVEIFSNGWWQRSTDDILNTCIERHKSVV